MARDAIDLDAEVWRGLELLAQAGGGGLTAEMLVYRAVAMTLDNACNDPAAVAALDSPAFTAWAAERRRLLAETPTTA